jgi:hypothetical protein
MWTILFLIGLYLNYLEPVQYLNKLQDNFKRNGKGTKEIRQVLSWRHWPKLRSTCHFDGREHRSGGGVGGTFRIRSRITSMCVIKCTSVSCCSTSSSEMSVFAGHANVYTGHILTSLGNAVCKFGAFTHFHLIISITVIVIDKVP